MVELRKGQTVYSRSGAQLEVSELLDGDRALVFPILMGSGWEGETEYYQSDHPVIYSARDLFEQPPLAAQHAELATLEKSIQALRDEVRIRQAEMRTFDLEERARKDRITRHHMLEKLDDYIAGKITHVIIIGTDDLALVPFQTAITSESRYSRKETKLLSLFGDSKGDLAWRINSYSDDSGTSWKTVALFCSLDDAKAELDRLMEVDLTAWRATPDNGLLGRIKKAHHNVSRPLPDDVERYMHDLRLKAAEAKFLSARKALTDAAAALVEERKHV